MNEQIKVIREKMADNLIKGFEEQIIEEIPFHRKGVVWYYWTMEERKIFAQAVKAELTPIMFNDRNVWEDATGKSFSFKFGLPLKLFLNKPWWIKEWNVHCT